MALAVTVTKDGRVTTLPTPASPRIDAPPPSPPRLPPQSQPLYFKAFVGGSEENLKLQLAAYAALDVVEEKVHDRKSAAARAAAEVATAGAGGGSGAAAAAAAAAKDPFLGILMPVDEYKV